MSIDQEEIYSHPTNIIDEKEESKKVGKLTSISEKDRLTAAKQILVGLAAIFLFTLLAYVIRPEQGEALLEICKTVLPPLVTLIIAFYFKDKCA